MSINKQDLKDWINELNELQKEWIECIEELRANTKQAINDYIGAMLNIWMTDVTQLSDHFKWITLLSDEKGKQFSNAQKLKYFYTKRNAPLKKLKDLRHSLILGEVKNLKKLKVYKDSVQNIVKKEKQDLEENYDIVQFLSKYIDVIKENKDNSNKRLEKVYKNLKSRLEDYPEGAPLIEFWQFLGKKYESMMRNNSLYVVFIDNVKVKIENIINTYTNATKGAYKDLVKITEDMDNLNNSFSSEDPSTTDQDDVNNETSNLVSAIDLVTLAIEDIYSHIENFIKTLYASLSALVAYEGTYIQQNEELVKNQRDFLTEFDADFLISQKAAEIEATNQILPEILEELDLINRSIEDQPEDIKGLEGRHQIPYKSKEPSSMSENNSWPSQISESESNKAIVPFKETLPHFKSVEVGVDREDIMNASPGTSTPIKNRKTTYDFDSRRSQLKDFKSASAVVEDPAKKASPFKLVKFKEINSSIIDEEKERFEQSTNDKKEEDENTSSFEKKFGLQKGEKLVDSFTCALARKILLHGRLYISNQRLCFHSIFNNKLLFFGKDTKVTIPLEDITSLEKRINALVFDNSIAVITKNEKETFFTSFLMRDKAFEVIKELLEKDSKGKVPQNTNMLKRTFVRYTPQETHSKTSLVNI